MEIEKNILNPRIPEGPIDKKWTNFKTYCKLVSPANKENLEIIVVGTGLAGASAAATLGELGYNVKVFCYSDTPRRAHSIAAQGGINAAKNYRNDGDTVYRLFLDTIKGGDYRSREANVFRLAELSNAIIDHCVAQGIPFARDYAGYLDTRSFGGALLARTFYARGQTGQQLLLGAYGALNRQVKRGKVKIYPRHDVLNIVLYNGKARGIIARDLITGEIKRFSAHAVVLATGGYGNVYFYSTNAKNSNGSLIWRAYKKGALFANPCFVQIHPTCIPIHGEYQSKLTLMSESLRNDGRVWVPKDIETAKKLQRGEIKANDIKPEDRDYFLERRYPTYGNLVPRDIASRAVKERCDAGFGVNKTGRAVFLDLSDAIKKLGIEEINRRYLNLFQMYEKITNENPYETPMMIYPGVHYTMGGLWVDYLLMTTIPGLFAIGECNFSDHGANRLGASALMQGLADGYFILPVTIGDYLASMIKEPPLPTDIEEFNNAEKEVIEEIEKLFSTKKTETVDNFHKRLGEIMWNKVGMSRNEKGLKEAIQEIRELREDFWKNVIVPGTMNELNQELEKALRVADFLELAELIAYDALHRKESCGSHFREEYQTIEGECLRDDENFAYVAAWKFNGLDKEPILYKDILEFKEVKVGIRSYK